jgi:hypothetical protein
MFACISLLSLALRLDLAKAVLILVERAANDVA